MEITDAYMAEQLEGAAPYTVALMYRGPRYDDPAARGLSRTTDGRFALRAQGVLDIVMPLPPGPGSPRRSAAWRSSPRRRTRCGRCSTPIPPSRRMF